MGEGSSHKAAVTAWGRWSCCDSMAVVLSGTPGGRAAHKHPCEHPQHPLAERRGNLPLLMCVGGKRDTCETLHPTALQVGERPGGSEDRGLAGGRKSWEPQKIGVQNSIPTCRAALPFTCQSLISMPQSPSKFAHLPRCSPSLPSTTLQLRARAV